MLLSANRNISPSVAKQAEEFGSFFSALGALNKVVGGDSAEPGRAWVPHGAAFNPFGFLQGV